MTVFIFILLIVLLILIWALVEFFNILFRSFAPLVFSRKKAIEIVLDNIQPRPGQLIYELGSGSARFLQMAEKRFPGLKMIGLECSLIPFLASKLILRLKKSAIQIRWKNVLKADLSSADFIYSYLLPGMMPEIGRKIRSECRPGTMLVSYMFSVPGWEPKQTIREERDRIYFYQV